MTSGAPKKEVTKEYTIILVNKQRKSQCNHCDKIMCCNEITRVNHIKQCQPYLDKYPQYTEHWQNYHETLKTPRRKSKKRSTISPLNIESSDDSMDSEIDPYVRKTKKRKIKNTKSGHCDSPLPPNLPFA